MEKILIADETTEESFITSSLFSPKSHEILQTKNEKDALDMAPRELSEVLTAAILRPLMSGLEICYVS
ncbi:hypothetical protein WDW89_11755 [Deltaproteobacteria bacterium TL4]